MAGRDLQSAFDASRRAEYVHDLNTLHTVDFTALQVLRLLARTPRLSQRQVASSVGVSLGKMNYCLRALVAKGFVKAQNYRKSSNKRAYLYLLTPGGIAAKTELARQFLAHRLREYDALRKEIECLEREAEYRGGSLV